MNPLKFQLQIIRIVDRPQGLVFCNDSVLEQREYGLIECLRSVHCVVAGHQVWNFIGPARISDAVGDYPCIPHDLDGRDSASHGCWDEALGQRGLEHTRELGADLLVVVRVKEANDAIDGLGGIDGVKCAEHEVTSFRSVQRDLNGFLVAEFTNKNDVRVLA